MPLALQVFKFVVSKGINLFDTADSYGTGRLNGQSEKLLGQFTAQLPQRKQSRIAIATKIAPYPWRLTAGQFADACRWGSSAVSWTLAHVACLGHSGQAAARQSWQQQGCISGAAQHAALGNLHPLGAECPAGCRASLKRVGRDQIALGQLHWSTANYQPLQERALWDGLAAMYDQVRPHRLAQAWAAPRRCARCVPLDAQRKPCAGSTATLPQALQRTAPRRLMHAQLRHTQSRARSD